MLPSATIGGAEKHTACLCRWLRHKGCDLHLLVPSVLGAIPDLGGIDVEYTFADILWSDEQSFLSNVQRQETYAHEALIAVQPDLCIVPLPWPTYGLGLQLACEQSGVPFVSILHLVPPEIDPSLQDLVKSHVFGRLNCDNHAWIAVSKPTALKAAPIFNIMPNKIHVIKNAAAMPPVGKHNRLLLQNEFRLLLGLPISSKIVTYIGRLEEHKGILDLIEANSLIGHSDYLLCFLGDGSLSEIIREKSTSVDNIRYIGYSIEAEKWLIASDMLVIPSKLEGWPLVFQEAAACCCPVVASSSALECLGEEAAAQALITVNDTPKALAEAITAVLTEPEMFQPRVDNAYSFARNYTELNMSQHYTRIFAMLGNS